MPQATLSVLSTGGASRFARGGEALLDRVLDCGKGDGGISLWCFCRLLSAVAPQSLRHPKSRTQKNSHAVRTSWQRSCAGSFDLSF